jgi:agmatine/peptidylarginine deiminase
MRLLPSIRVIQVPNNDGWLRGSGPIFVKSTNLQVEDIVRVVVFNFTTWGGPTEPAYADYSLDTQFAESVASRKCSSISCWHGPGSRVDFSRWERNSFYDRRMFIESK